MTPERTAMFPDARWPSPDPRGFGSSQRNAFTPLPRRVLMTVDTVGGVWTYAMELARALADLEVEVALATMGDPLTSAQKDEVEKLCNTGVFESTFKLEWMEDPWREVQQAGEWLLNLERQLRPDIIHLNGYAHGVLPFRAPKVIVGHSCVLSWWRAVKGQSAPSHWDTYRKAVGEGLRNADHVIAPSRAMLRDLVHDYGPLGRADVVYNGRALRYGNAPTIRLPAKEPIVFSAGRLWDEAKNIVTLTSVAKQLSWKVMVAGDATDSFGRTQIVEGVQSLGRLDTEELLTWFARASIYASPARYEPFGLSAVEAGLSRCALVLGDIPSLREIWGDAALFVKPNDTAALLHAIEELIHDDGLRSDMASRARNRALEFSPTQMAASYLAIYSELAKKEHPEPEFICIS